MNIKSLPLVFLYLILLNGLIGGMLPERAVYRHRLSYPLILDNRRNIDAALEQIRNQIRRDRLDHYVIVLGDSVFFGSPGSSDQCPSAFMEQEAGDRTIFNLALPAAQTGDIYTMLLMLDRYGISTKSLIFNVRYASFVPRHPYPPVVFWWTEELRRLDPAAFAKMVPQLESTGYQLHKPPYQWLTYMLNEKLFPLFGLMQYKDYVRKYLNEEWLRLTGRQVPDDALDTPVPWYEKDRQAIQNYMEDAQLKEDFTDDPLDLTPANPDIYFMDRIMRHQAGTDTMVVLTGANEQLMSEYVRKTGYQDNLKRLDEYFARQPVQYLNLEGRISDRLFTAGRFFGGNRSGRRRFIPPSL
jgi:hypothetical protein